jgi:hypothetical protein
MLVYDAPSKPRRMLYDICGTRVRGFTVVALFSARERARGKGSFKGSSYSLLTFINTVISLCKLHRSTPESGA